MEAKRVAAQLQLMADIISKMHIDTLTTICF